MANRSETSLLEDVAEYYSQKIAIYGDSPRGVDWNSAESQFLRFEQLCKVITTSAPFTVNDLGCGYGAFFEYLENRYNSFVYTGIDVSKDMISAAVNRYRDKKNAQFIHASEPGCAADYSVASGIFNVRMDRSYEEWKAYIEMTLDVLHKNSKYGFAFNCLTSYSDADKMQDYLFYANPCEIFDYCKRHYSRKVALLHDYQLYEFTVLVRE